MSFVTTEIQGTPKKLRKEDVKLLGEFTKFSLLSLLKEARKTHMGEIHVSIRFVPNFEHRGQIEPGTYTVGKKLSKFTILLDDKLTTRKAYLILSHELVHVKQIILGEYKDAGTPQTVYWYGKAMKLDNDDDSIYWDSPWEIEAYGKELGLVYRWVKSTAVKRPWVHHLL